MSNYKEKLVEAIKGKQNKEKALWLENYVKHGIKSYGVGIPEIREMLIELDRATDLSKASITVQSAFLNDLMKDEYTELKLAAILFMQMYWKSEEAVSTLNITSSWFDNEWISDWNVCDWLCVRLLTPLLDKEPALTISVLSEWNISQNVWKARASLVPFALSKNIANHIKMILQFSTVLIMRDERFCKTAVGWVLREYSKIDTQVVKHFLETYSDWTTKEVVKNATKYINKD